MTPPRGNGGTRIVAGVVRSSARAALSARVLPHRVDGLEQALTETPDGALVVGEHGTVILWNRAAEAIMGYGAAEAAGRTCRELLRCGSDVPGDRACQPLPGEADSVRTFDLHTRTKDGRTVWLNVTVAVVPVPRGGSLVLHLFRDVTATREVLALIRCLGGPEDDGGTGDDRTLTRREREVLRLIKEGLNTAAAAERLHVSRATIRNHVQNILWKLGVHSRLQALAHAERHRLL